MSEQKASQNRLPEVYCVGTVDYDIRTELPQGVYASLEGAMGHVEKLTADDWQQEDPAREQWWADAGDEEWIISRYEVQP